MAWGWCRPRHRAGRIGLVASMALAPVVTGCGATPPAAQPVALAPARIAEQAAAGLLSAVTPPAGAEDLGSNVDEAIANAVQGGVPAVSTRVIRSHYWRVRRPFTELTGWPQGQRPTGTQRSSGQTGAVRGRSTMSAITYSVTAPDPALVSADLTAAVGVDPHDAGATITAAHAVVVWWNTTPLPDAGAGPRVRITIAGGCPPSIEGVGGVQNTGNGLDAAILPPGEITGGLICRYPGLSGGRLRAKVLDAADATRLAAAVRAVPLAHVDGAHSCPMDQGQVAVLVFGVVGRQDVDVWWHLDGCQGMSNGTIAATGGPDVPVGVMP